MTMKTKIAAACVGALVASAPGFASAADGVIRIGILNDQSGVFADNGGRGSVIAAQLAAEDFNNEVIGQRIEIVDADHQNKADIASATARKWFDTQGVDLIADGAASSAGFAILEAAKERRKIFIVNGPASSDFTGKACTPYSFHFTYDTYALSKITATAVTKAGGKSWYFITADYAFGHALQRDATKFIEAAGGKVLGQAAHPLGTTDFSSFLLQAQASKANVVGLATSGADVQTAIKQAGEFGLVEAGQKLAGLLVFVTDVKALGVKAAQGLQITTSFYWDLNDETRAWTKRFQDRLPGRVPSMIHAGVYSGVKHYLQSVKALGTKDSVKVAEKMHQMPVNDMYNKNVVIRPDGRVLHDMYLMQVKTPAESKGPFDFYNIVQRFPGAEAFRPLSESECPLIKR